MIVTGEARWWTPSIVARWAGRRARRIAEANPGFERVVIQVRPGPAVDTGVLVNPTAEPDIRAALRWGFRLDPGVVDPEPYVML